MSWSTFINFLKDTCVIFGFLTGVIALGVHWKTLLPQNSVGFFKINELEPLSMPFFIEIEHEFIWKPYKMSAKQLENND